ncbi:hypothetical protein B0T22DRAFT_189458 [Podospora appendiculata]|uniref:Uncharacterized protein n=1 Tax=Podospora appendiculata TaxID=314037 RepID=A0AAE0XCY9_9PEZI|nr:hypothetical protein B0T22DRAFT_189458 [Podospora appendiculata]
MDNDLWGPNRPLRIVMGVYAGVAAFLAIVILVKKSQSPTSITWVPSIFLTDGCLIVLYPFLLLAPAILWPLVVVWHILALICKVIYFIWKQIVSDFNGLQSCCGIKRPARGENDDVEMGSENGTTSSPSGAASGGICYEQVKPTPQPSVTPVVAQPDRAHLASQDPPPSYSET